MGAGKNKIQNRISFVNRVTYKEFMLKHPDCKISYGQYIKILKESTSAIKNHILENPLGFKPPYNLGYIAVDKFKAKPKYKAVDWVATRRLGKIIPLTNLHSLGYMYTIKLYANPKMHPLKILNFKAHRLLNRQLGYNILNSVREYIHIDRNYLNARSHTDNYLKEK